MDRYSEKYTIKIKKIKKGTMMADMQVYECVNCGNTVEVGSDESKTPECCGNAMKPAEDLKACGLSSTAEHSRLDDFDEPCDDGRSG
jgi:hypothetical protein